MEDLSDPLPAPLASVTSAASDVLVVSEPEGVGSLEADDEVNVNSKDEQGDPEAKAEAVDREAAEEPVRGDKSLVLSVDELNESNMLVFAISFFCEVTQRHKKIDTLLNGAFSWLALILDGAFSWQALSATLQTLRGRIRDELPRWAG